MTLDDILYAWDCGHLSDAAVKQLRQITHRTNQDRTMSDAWLEMVWPAGTDM